MELTICQKGVGQSLEEGGDKETHFVTEFCEQFPTKSSNNRFLIRAGPRGQLELEPGHHPSSCFRFSQLVRYFIWEAILSGLCM